MDLFAAEQKMYDDAMAHVEEVHKGAHFDFESFVAISKEYGKLLTQIRRVTRFANRATVNSFDDNLNNTDMVYIDELTGIYNRRFMETSLERSIKYLSRTNGIMSIMIVDIDFLQKYNDIYGHKAGDTCLKTVAETLSNVVAREEDFVARYENGEFVIV